MRWKGFISPEDCKHTLLLLSNYRPEEFIEHLCLCCINNSFIISIQYLLLLLVGLLYPYH